MAQIDRFLKLLIEEHGSDFHVGSGVSPMIRIHGSLKKIDIQPLVASQVQGLLNEIMDQSAKDAFEKYRDADFAYEAPGLGRFRVNAFTQKNGPSAVFRVVPTEIPSPDSLGLPLAVRQLSFLHQGLVLVTGATGSGKSTTLAAMVDLINDNRAAHVLTIEDPIEFVHHSKRCLINQREIGQHAYSFSRALRAGLREDPDVILVGEMRDVETIGLAVTAAETGHLVLATLHTNSAAKSIDRIIDSFPSEQQSQIRVQLSEGLKAVVSQQLLPTTNGKGRVAAFEILIGNVAIANLIRESKTHQIPSTMLTHGKDGMKTMDASLIDLVEEGHVSAREAVHHSHNRKQFLEELKKRNLRV